MKSIVIIGRRWFNKAKGHSYYSAIALVDGVEVVTIAYADGYGSEFEYESFRRIEQKGLLPAPVGHYESTGGMEDPSRYCERNNIAYVVSVTTVRRRKDL